MILPFPRFLVMHIPLVRLQLHCEARSILGAGPYSVTTFVLGFGKHLLGLRSLPYVVTACHYLGW
jgi:hypothetical protein